MEGKKNNRTTINLILIVAILLLLTVNVVVIGGLLRQSDNTPVASAGVANGEQTPEETEVVKVEDRIAIPGYEAIQLSAGTLEQTISFPNPAQNCCYFQISLYLEDGTLLWKSEDVAPGENSQPVVLNQTLEAGTYKNALLKYECFTMDKDHTQLNGAQTKLMLQVKEG